MIVLAFLKLHWASISWTLGAWAALATALNRILSKPAAPPWKRALYLVLIDWPAALPATNLKGLFGLPFNVPYLTLSTDAQAAKNEPPPTKRDGGFVWGELIIVTGFIALLFLIAALVIGCAAGTDGLRQACATADSALMASYSAAGAVFKADQDTLRAGATPTNVLAVRDKALAHARAFNEALNGLDRIAASSKLVCDLAPAIDAGLKKDLGALIAQLVGMSSDIQKVLEVFKGVL